MTRWITVHLRPPHVVQLDLKLAFGPLCKQLLLQLRRCVGKTFGVIGGASFACTYL